MHPSLSFRFVMGIQTQRSHCACDIHAKILGLTTFRTALNFVQINFQKNLWINVKVVTPKIFALNVYISVSRGGSAGIN